MKSAYKLLISALLLGSACFGDSQIVADLKLSCPTSDKGTGIAAAGIVPAGLLITSFGFAVTNPATLDSSARGLTAGKAAFQAINISKEVDDCTPSAMGAVAKGEVLSPVKVQVIETPLDGKTRVSIEIELTSAILTSQQFAGYPGAPFQEKTPPSVGTQVRKSPAEATYRRSIGRWRARCTCRTACCR